MAYFERAAADNVRHAEIFFDPQTHTDRGVGFDVVMEGLLSAMAEAKTRLGLTSKLILCFLRHLSEEAALATLAEAEPWLEQIAGVGLDSSEQGHPPSKFARVFAAAAAKGLKLVAHAGEEGPPAYVWEALDLLQIDRIDHGNRSLEDPALVQRIIADGLTLTVCPLSNHKLCVVSDLAHHPIKRMLDMGLKATINSDDPAYFGGYVNANFSAVTKAVGLTRDEIVTLAKNSFTGAFLTPAEIAAHLAEIDAYCA
jgi:adenosine deaminase